MSRVAAALSSVTFSLVLDAAAVRYCLISSAIANSAFGVSFRMEGWKIFCEIELGGLRYFYILAFNFVQYYYIGYPQVDTLVRFS